MARVSGGSRWREALSWHSVATQVFVLLVTVVMLLVTGAVAAFVWSGARHSLAHAREQTLTAAQEFARSPGTVAALNEADPPASLQSRAREAGAVAGTDVIVVMNPQGIRYTDRDPKRIGTPYPGSIERALRGETYTEHSGGWLGGGTVQALTPVTDRNGAITGVVATEIETEHLVDQINRELAVLLVSAVGTLLLGTGGAALVSSRLRRQTHGLGHEEITRLYEHHDAVLHSVREGVLIIDDERRLLLANDEAQRLLGLGDDALGLPVTSLGLDPPIAALLASGQTATDEIHLASERVLAVNLRPTQSGGHWYGSVATLRDTTELRALTGKADLARGRLRLLNEASVRIGSTLDVTRTAEELVEVTVPGFADAVTVDLLDSVLAGREPSESGALLRRVAARGAPHGTQRPAGRLGHSPSTPQARAFDSGQAVLVSGDVQGAPETATSPEADDGAPPIMVAVPLRARGASLGVASFWRSADSEPFEGDDLAVAEELATRAAVCIDNARRYTREHATAVTLQRSLLPRGMPEQLAVEAAHRYLPAQAGVGGDWFDVLALSGARVALVVGDVVGHGLHAAATMGRLRTAVHNFSALDLPPDELLAHLDDLVGRLEHDVRPGEGEAGITGATCLYAVYDPVSRLCTVARAGHPPPALVHPDGTVEFLDIPAGPPLGLGGLPFETVTLTISEGSQLVLYTDGLIESRSRDIDTGLELLRRALACADRAPEETCEAVLRALLPVDNDDDIALLVARTRAVAAEQTASWDVPAVPNAVADVRKAAVRQLAHWGLEDTAFTTELVLSELVTNAIRHGAGPIQVRLLRDSSLICEVSDGSITAPHLRRAVFTDEGGRGLFLVAQCTERWGTRYTDRGKVIWTEQFLPAVVIPTP